MNQAVRPVIQALEERRMLSAALTLVNTDNFPSNNRMVFNVIQTPNSLVPNVVHNTGTLEIEDTGDQPLTITSLVLNGPWQFVNAPAGNYANTVVNPGSPLNVTLQFTQTTVPPHSSNETNYGTNPNGGAAITGSLTVNSNAPTAATQTVTLAGYWQIQSEDNAEPSLATIANTVLGYGTVISTPYMNDLAESGNMPTLYGDEVNASSWSAANPTQPVTVREVGDWHVQGNVSQTYWYDATTQSSTSLFATQASQGQTFLPTTTSGAALQASFSPSGSFGLRVDDEYSDDAINIANNEAGGFAHHWRFYPLKDSSGNVIPNTWLAAVDSDDSQTENYDYNNNVYVITNMRPVTNPPTPAGLTITSGAAPALSWDAVDYPSLAGYDVYRSTSLTGLVNVANELTATTSTSYTDSTAPLGHTLYYAVTAVDSVTGGQSAPATGTANTPGGPVAVAQSFAAYAGQPLTINLVAADTDTTGSIVPTSMAITQIPNHGGTATVDSTTGLVTYTPLASFSGTETLQYTVTDSNNAVSAPGTVTFNVINGAAIKPTAAPDSADVLANKSVTIAVLSVDTSQAALVPSSMAFVLAPTNGETTINSDGTITYVPNPNFVGTDTFSYTVNDANGNLSNTALVTVNVGVEISSAKGANKSIAYTDQSGTAATITLNRGIADVFFAGAGSESTAKGKISITGTNITIATITASGTTAASMLAIHSPGNKGSITLGGLTDTSALGAINAPIANLVGIVDSPTVTLGGASSILLKSIETSEIQVGATGTSHLAFNAGAVTDSDLTSAVTITSLKAASWTNQLHNPLAITAPAINTLTIGGEFDPNLDLSGASLGNAKIAGPVSIGLWNLSGGAHSITVGGVTNSWGLTAAGTLGNFTVKAGNLPANISAGGIGALKVAGTISDAQIRTTGSIKSITAGGINASDLYAGVAAAVAVPAAMGDFSASAYIATVHVTGTFADSNVAASTIKNLSLGTITTNNSGTAFGVETESLAALMAKLDSGTTLHLTHTQLVNQATINAALGSGANDFKITLI